MWRSPRSLTFKSIPIYEPIDEASAFYPLKKISGGFRTIVTDRWAGRRWAIHDNGYWLEFKRTDDGKWIASFGFCS